MVANSQTGCINSSITPFYFDLTSLFVHICGEHGEIVEKNSKNILLSGILVKIYR
jgi:hypothetical protein